MDIHNPNVVGTITGGGGGTSGSSGTSGISGTSGSSGSSGSSGTSGTSSVTATGTDNAIATYDGTESIQGTDITIDDSNNIGLADATHIEMDDSPASDHTATGDVITDSVDQNTYGLMGLLVLSSDGNWDDADASAEATVGKLALALESGTGTKKILLRGIARDDTWNFTPGKQLFISITAGTITETAPSTSGEFIQVVGYAKTADIIFFEPSQDYLEVD